MNKEALEKLRDSVAARDPEYFDQNLFPEYFRIMRKNPPPIGVLCGCVQADARKIMSEAIASGLTVYQDLYASLSPCQYCWVFGSRMQIKEVADESGLECPVGFGPIDAANRIQQVIDGIFGS